MGRASDRFSRQTRFTPFGAAGQARLERARVAVVGLGGLGSWIAEHLARAGVGTLRLVDRDVVEESNLPRQALYTNDDVAHGRPKAEAAALHLAAIAGPTRLEPLVRDFSRRTADELLGGCDLVMDGLDHFAGRFLLNDWCRKHAVPWVHGGAVGGAGSVLLIEPKSGPCLRCLFPTAEGTVGADTCDTVGVLSPLPALIAAMQTSEALRHLAGDTTPARLWHLEPWAGHVVALKPGPSSPSCPVCSRTSFPALVSTSSEDAAVKLCGRDTVQIDAPSDATASATTGTIKATAKLDLADFERRWQGLGQVERSRFLVRLRIDALVLSLFEDGRALVQGTSSLDRARQLYERLIGR